VGLKEWAEKNKAGSPEQLAKKADRAAKREGLRTEFAATKAKLVDVKAEFAANNAHLKTGLAATKAEFSANNADAKAGFAAIQAEAAANKTERAASSVDLKEELAATKAKWDEDRAELAGGREVLRAERSEKKLERVQAKETAPAERDAGGPAWARKAQLAQLDRKAAKGESFEGVTLKLGQVQYKGQGGSVAGATARVESAADIHGRITATRVLALGIFALGAKKQKGHVFLTVEAPGFEFLVELPVKKEAEARGFATKINNAARHVV
jgi:hypothetical protein